MEYREMRDRMMQTNGTTAQETFSVILPSFFYTSLAVLLVSSLGVTSGTAAFFVEFVTLVAPIILNITVLSEYNVEIVVAAASLYLLILLPFSRKRERTAEKNTDFITNARATITIISVIAILAVDFTVFPRKFAKTEHFGYSLMDVGVGLFVFSNGIVDSTRRHPISSTLPLIILAVARFVTVNQLDYHVPVSEYGVHWNFFATLAITKLFTNLLLSVINIKFILINSIMLLFSHELLLQNGLANLILSTKIKRSDGFVAANKEGIGSCLGYISIYLLAAYFSHLLDLRNTKTRTKTTLLKFVAVCGLFLGLTVLLGAHFGVSRKLANSAYCCWVLFIGFFMTGLFYGNGALTGQGAPRIFRAVNYNGLIFFLSCNVCTGLVNILCDSLKVGPAGGLAIVFGYMFVNCAFVCVLYAKRIKPNF